MKKFFIMAVIFSLMIFSIQTIASDGTLTKVGQKAPEFKVTNLEGKEFSSKNFEGKVVLINFFATWCPPCKAEFPHLEKEVWQKYKDRNDFILLSIGREETAEKLMKFKKDMNVTFPMAPDPKRQVYSLFAEKMIPRNYILNRKGEIIYQAIGYSPEEFEKLKMKLAEELENMGE